MNAWFSPSVTPNLRGIHGPSSRDTHREQCPANQQDEPGCIRMRKNPWERTWRIEFPYLHAPASDVHSQHSTIGTEDAHVTILEISKFQPGFHVPKACDQPRWTLFLRNARRA